MNLQFGVVLVCRLFKYIECWYLIFCIHAHHPYVCHKVPRASGAIISEDNKTTFIYQIDKPCHVVLRPMLLSRRAAHEYLWIHFMYRDPVWPSTLIVETDACGPRPLTQETPRARGVGVQPHPDVSRVLIHPEARFKCIAHNISENN